MFCVQVSAIRPREGPKQGVKAGDEDEDGEVKGGVELYGIWQTDEYEPPVAIDGVVPKNDHGNAEVPPLVGCVPIGTVHLPHPRVISVCKRLGVDFAQALVGFEGEVCSKADLRLLLVLNDSWLLFGVRYLFQL